jgi:phosphatidylglycerol lysyltransferase
MMNSIAVDSRWNRFSEKLRRDWPAILAGFAILANGVGILLQVLLVRLGSSPRFLTLPMPYGLYHWGKLLSLVLGFLLMYLSLHVFQRRRTAWWVAMGSLGLSVVFHLGRGRHWYLASVPVVTFVLLVVFRNRFRVRSEVRSMVTGVTFMLLSFAAALLFGFVGFYMLERREFNIDFSAAQALVHVLREYLLIGNPDLVPQTRYAYWFIDAMRALGATGVAFALYSLFRPLAFRLQELPHERARAASLLEQYGRIPEHYFVTWSDKSYFFGADGNGVIAYHVANGVAVGLGDPLCAPENILRLVREFRDFCADNGWKTALVYALPDFLPVYEQVGLRALKIGADAVVDLEQFCTVTLLRKEFRKFRRRFQERGFSVARFMPPHAPDLLDQFEAVSRGWLSIPGKSEHTFAVGPFTREYANRTPVFAVLDPQNRVAAFCNEIPAYRPGLATIDMMRHRLDVPTGIMDFLFTELFLFLRDEGCRQFNMGMAPTMTSWGDVRETLEERLVRAVFERVNRFSYAGLTAYKTKFAPEWEPRFLVYESVTSALARTGIALSRII